MSVAIQYRIGTIFHLYLFVFVLYFLLTFDLIHFQKFFNYWQSFNHTHASYSFPIYIDLVNPTYYNGSFAATLDIRGAQCTPYYLCMFPLLYHAWNLTDNRARNKRTLNVNDVALLAPDAPNLCLERQDDAASCLKF